ncbi:MAG: 50S ribosomal protein L23 [Fidelibacterota bacterium]|nr:MAG: 50S ribosomal protein L23 [Candidatus Neomarinimicrobiota bacterium]
MTLKTTIIIRPLVTEKMSHLEETQRKYAFQVHPQANKMEIKAAVEQKFGVKVMKVATNNRAGKAKSMTTRSGGRTIRTQGQRSHWKRAIVTLAEGQKIDLFGPEGAV